MGECVTDASIIKYLQDRDKMFKKDETLLERVKQRGAEMMKKVVIEHWRATRESEKNNKAKKGVKRG